MDDKIRIHLQRMDPATLGLLQPFFARPSADEWIRDVLRTYFHYFLSVGEKDEVNQAAKRALQAGLKPLVPVGKRRSLDRMEEFLYDEFHRKGYYFLGGKTGPYYGPYIWKRTRRRVFEVELPERRERVNVFFMHDFLIRSWMHFQTYGRRGTGGWVKREDAPWEDGLYCVAESYDLQHLDKDWIFQVSLLKHEAQHFADKRDFPDLNGMDLEYRAKLVELIYFSEMKYRFIPILHEAGPIKADPHRYAAHLIVQEMSERVLGRVYEKNDEEWQSVPYEKIQAEALQLFQEHTRRLKTSPRNRRGVL